METVNMQTDLRSPSGIAISCTFTEDLPNIARAYYKFPKVLDAQGVAKRWAADQVIREDGAITALHVFASDGSETVKAKLKTVLYFVDETGKEYPSDEFMIVFA